MPLYPPKTQKNQNFHKIKKVVGDTILLHMCTKYNHMICLLRYGVWQTEVFAILGHFIALLPHKQLKILEK